MDELLFAYMVSSICANFMIIVAGIKEKKP